MLSPALHYNEGELVGDDLVDQVRVCVRGVVVRALLRACALVRARPCVLVRQTGGESERGEDRVEVRVCVRVRARVRACGE